MRSYSIYTIDYAFLIIGFIPFLLLNGKSELILYERLSILSTLVLPFITMGFHDSNKVSYGVSAVHLQMLVCISILLLVLIVLFNRLLLYAPILAIWGYMRSYNLLVLKKRKVHIALFLLNLISVIFIYFSLEFFLMSISLMTLIILILFCKKTSSHGFVVDLNLIGNQIAQQVVPSLVRFDSSNLLPGLPFFGLAIYKLQNIALITLSHWFVRIRNGHQLEIIGILGVVVITVLNLLFLPLELFSVFLISASKVLLNVLSARDFNLGNSRVASLRTYSYSMVLLLIYFISSSINLAALVSIFILIFFYIQSNWRF